MRRTLHLEDDAPPAAPHWMVTYSDLATLLLAFFVLIVSMSSVEAQPFQEAMSYFRKSEQTASPADSLQLPRQARRTEALVDYLNRSGLAGKVQVNATGKQVRITVAESVVFASGQAEMLPPAAEVLRRVGRVVDPGMQAVIVEGHTDDQPIASSIYPSNWELSSARAAVVVRFLLAQPNALPPSRYIATGFGEHRPLEPNHSPESRARNRRVEIIFRWDPWQNETNPAPLPASMRQP